MVATRPATTRRRLQIGLNALLMVCLVALSLLFLAYTSGYGLLLAPLAWVIAYGVFRRNRWGYFSAAVWSLACYQLAKEGLDFELVKRTIMMVSIPLVVLSVYLHEALGRAHASDQGGAER